MKIGFAIGLFVIGILIGFGLSNLEFTGNAVEGLEYEWTTAVCDENSCIDVFVTCKNGEVTGMQLQSDHKEFDFNWTDPRDNIEDYCI